MSEISGTSAALSYVYDQVNQIAHDELEIRAKELCGWINYEIQQAAVIYRANVEMGNSNPEMIQLYDPDHAQLRISHLALHLGEVFEARVESGEDDLSVRIVVSAKDDREITDEMYTTLQMAIDDGMKMGS